jgi:hypothetical protein
MSSASDSSPSLETAFRHVIEGGLDKEDNVIIVDEKTSCEAEKVRTCMLVPTRRPLASLLFFHRFCLNTKLAANAAAPYNSVVSMSVLTILAQHQKQQQQHYHKSKNHKSFVAVNIV